MTVPVGLDQVRSEAAKYGDRPYLLTVSDDGHPHAVSVRVRFEEGEITMPGGNRSRANASTRPDVTLLWPTAEDGGFSLIVDGLATVQGEHISIRPSAAILHRTLAVADDGVTGSECKHLA